jgi:hypothetical protein
MINKAIDYAHRLLPKLTRQPNRRIRNSNLSYVNLERRQVLTRIILPETTTNLDAFNEAVESATIRINDQSDLVIRLQDTTTNYVEINLNFGFIRVNSTDQEPVLGIETDRYERVLVIGDGNDDRLVVTGDGLRAQLHPQRTWIKDESLVQALGQEFTVQGTNLEHVEIDDFITPFTGGLYSSNTVRMFGSDGSDHLTMTDSNNVTMVGEGYTYRADSVRRLFAFAKGGENFANILGTREIPGEDTETEFERPQWHCAVAASIRNCFPYRSSSGTDQFYATDNFANLQNEFLDARFVDFGTTRVDLLSGVDNVHIQDTASDSTWYRIDGESLVGANRRFINSERITIDGSQIANDQLLAPASGEFEESETEAKLAFSRDATIPLAEEEQKYEKLNQVFPDNFYWRWVAFEDVFHSA